VDTFAAVLSCHEKAGLAPFAKQLHEAGLRLIASDGTYRYLTERSIPAIRLEDYTEQARGCLARTLQPKIHEGLLADHADPGQMARLRELGISPVRVVVSDIYPLRALLDSGAINTTTELTHEIDVGGPAMLTAAARNYQSVFAVSDVEDFDEVAAALVKPLNHTGTLRRRLAGKALRTLSLTNAAASDFLLRGEPKTVAAPRRDGAALIEILEFLARADRLKLVDRANGVADGTRPENSAEHSWQAALAGYLLASYSRSPVDATKVAMMLLTHDIIEVESGDFNLFAPEAASRADHEAECAVKVFGHDPFGPIGRAYDLWTEFENGETAEARFAKAIDQFLPLFLNVMGEGKSWGDFIISQDAYLQKKADIRAGSDELWVKTVEYVEYLKKRAWSIV